MADKDAKAKTIEFLEDYTFEIMKGVFIALDLTLSRCNSFEDFKVCVKRTIDNLAGTGEENDK